MSELPATSIHGPPSSNISSANEHYCANIQAPSTVVRSSFVAKKLTEFPLFRGIQSICCTGRVSAEIAFSKTYSLVPSVDLHKKSCAMELRMSFPNSNAYVFGRFSTNYNLGLGIGVRPENSFFMLSPILGCYVNRSREMTPFYGVSWVWNLW